MEIFLIIIALICLLISSFYYGHSRGKLNLRQDYKDHYKEVQNERDNYKHKKPAFEEETMELLKKAYNILSPIKNQWEGRDTIPGQIFLAALRSAVNLPPQEKKISIPPQQLCQSDKITEYYKKVLQTNSECKHDYMGTLNPDVKKCRRCPSKIRKKPWEMGDGFGEGWIEDKTAKKLEAK